MADETAVVVVTYPDGYTQVFGPCVDPIHVSNRIHHALHKTRGTCEGVRVWITDVQEFSPGEMPSERKTVLDNPELLDWLAELADEVRKVGEQLAVPLPPEIGFQSVQALLDARKRRREGAFEEGEDERVAVYQAQELRRMRKALMDLAELSEPDDEGRGSAIAFEIATRALGGDDSPWENSGGEDK